MSEQHWLDRKLFNSSYDRELMWVVLLLIVFGMVMIYSASVDGRLYKTGNQYYYLFRQGLFFLISSAVGIIAFLFMPMKRWLTSMPVVVILSLVLLVLALVLGVDVKGARRWINLGFIHIQPAELFKLAVILYLSSYLYRKYDVLTQFKKVWFVAIVPALGAALILLSGDLGSMVITFIVTLALLFMAGLKWSWFASIVGVGTVAGILAVVFTPYRMRRITTFLHPESDPLGAGFQTIQSFVANAHGGLFGVGLGNGVARYGLPELHTDFIASLITEELGTLFLLILCFIYFWITIRAFSIGKRASDLDLLFSSYVAKGIGIWIGIQAFFHIGINTGLLPTKGLTLPFISYGGSSLMTLILATVILLRIDYENRRASLGYRI